MSRGLLVWGAVSRLCDGLLRQVHVCRRVGLVTPGETIVSNTSCATSMLGHYRTRVCPSGNMWWVRTRPANPVQFYKLCTSEGEMSFVSLCVGQCPKV